MSERIKALHDIRNKRYNRAFKITSVERGDITQVLVDDGYDIETAEKIALYIPEHEMDSIASKLADAYCDNSFWIDLEIIADEAISDTIKSYFDHLLDEDDWSIFISNPYQNFKFW